MHAKAKRQTKDNHNRTGQIRGGAGQIDENDDEDEDVAQTMTMSKSLCTQCGRGSCGRGPTKQ